MREEKLLVWNLINFPKILSEIETAAIVSKIFLVLEKSYFPIAKIRKVRNREALQSEAVTKEKVIFSLSFRNIQIIFPILRESPLPGRNYRKLPVYSNDLKSAEFPWVW